MAEKVSAALALAKTDKTAADVQLKEAEKDLSRLVTELPRGYQDELYQLKGVSNEGLNNRAKALDAYAKSLKLQASNPVVLFRHAFLLEQLGRCAEAVPELREVYWRTKENAHEVLYLTADCLLQLGRNDEALKLSEEARKQDPQFVPVLKLLVAARREQLATESDPSKKSEINARIADELGVIYKQDPEDREAGLDYGRFLLKNSDPLLSAGALKQAETVARALCEKSDYTDEESVKLLFDVLVKRGDLKNAEQTLAAGMEKKPDSALLMNAQKQLEIERGIEREQ